ncbi:uncharacterized protein LOC120747860 [Hirundo rustica]|uniref:uncharacterized protein LOC120747860 n=1 Tax=Hirundo rustica TaxID=43150 RepID=UPI002671C7FE|nr:uncharacterized protein LOC120747860 [Hirundo rustica]
MLSLERPFQVFNANRQPLPDGQPVTVDVKQTCRLYIAFDPAYKLDFNSWKEKKVLKIEMVRGHPSVEQITLWGEVHFPNLQIQPSTLEFGCVMAGTEEVHSLEMTNCSPLPVKYHWAFQTDSQANRVIYELHPPKFKPKPPKVKSIYVEHLPTQWRRFQIRNVEEPATTLEEFTGSCPISGAEVTFSPDYLYPDLCFHLRAGIAEMALKLSYKMRLCKVAVSLPPSTENGLLFQVLLPHTREKRYIPPGLGQFRSSIDLPHKVSKAPHKVLLKQLAVGEAVQDML